MFYYFPLAGSLFDQYGKYRKWWSNETRTEFNKRAQCFIDQFNNYLAFEPTKMTVI